ncbi:MAG: cysteine peptidase family C39 domain-containing protein [Candidatus Omnitrophica bacterium]|nr:cysteine peptidase family C39 domain-containing protein [Candidatus Omnitrophota bacterium]
MNKPLEQTDDRIVLEEEPKPKFRSNFKTWLRVVAFIVIAVFLPEQVAQAVEYDWRVIWNKPVIGMPLGSTLPLSGIKNLQNLEIPQAVRNILKDIANKPVTSIKISDNLTIELDKPLKMSNQRVDELYNWLQGKPCGSKAIFDFLTYKGIQVSEQDIAIMALTVDILNDLVKPEGNPEVIKNSLFALSKASEFFGLKTYPVKIANLNQELADNLGPFLAHVNGNHYVLVTSIKEDKVYFSDLHKEEFLALGKFLEKFSGYALVTKLTNGVTELSVKEAKAVMGAETPGDESYVQETPSAPVVAAPPPYVAPQPSQNNAGQSSYQAAPFNPVFRLDTGYQNATPAYMQSGAIAPFSLSTGTGYQAPTDFGIGSNTTLPIAQFTTQNDGSIGIKDVNVRVGDTYAANQC